MQTQPGCVVQSAVQRSERWWDAIYGCWLQERKDIDAYQSDPTEEKSGRKSSTYGPEMLETWLLLEFCDRCFTCISPAFMGVQKITDVVWWQRQVTTTTPCCCPLTATFKAHRGASVAEKKSTGVQGYAGQGNHAEADPLFHQWDAQSGVPVPLPDRHRCRHGLPPFLGRDQWGPQACQCPAQVH